MICEKCGQNPATVHFVTTEDETGKRTERHLCEPCCGVVTPIPDELPPPVLAVKPEPLSDEEIIETLKKHIPELGQGDVEIRFWVREPGVQALMAVFSPSGKFDPISVMVGGRRAERLKAIVKEIHEVISLILWKEKAEDFIHNAVGYLHADPSAPSPGITFDSIRREACVRVDQKTFEQHITNEGELLKRMVRMVGWELKIEIVPPPPSAG